MVSVIAHRGSSGYYPENTLLSFQAAIELDVDMVEFDVQLTSDGEVVVIHDEMVDRTTDGHGAVHELTLNQIRSLRTIRASAGEPIRVPTFGEVLDLLAGPVRLNINLKPVDSTRVALVKRVANEFESRGLYERAFIAADDQSLAEMFRVDPKVTRCSLDKKPAEDYITKSLALGCAILQPSYEMTTASLVAEAHSHGLEVNVFFANTHATMTEMILAGVDGILTDHPDALTKLMRGVM